MANVLLDYMLASVAHYYSLSEKLSKGNKILFS